MDWVGNGEVRWNLVIDLVNLCQFSHMVHPDTSIPAHGSYIFAHSFSRVIGDPAEAGPQMAALWDPLRPFWERQVVRKVLLSHSLSTTFCVIIMGNHKVSTLLSKQSVCEPSQRCVFLVPVLFHLQGAKGPLWIPVPVKLLGIFVHAYV